jgi:hypothetical protein
MSLDEIRSQLKQINDIDLITLLNEISDEVKRRNTILKGIFGDDQSPIKKESLKPILQTIIDALATKQK